jgi:hypothetical protein
MKLKNIMSVLGMILLLTGCASVSQQRAVIADGTIQNASLGFFGFSFKIPDGFEVYNPAAKNPAEYNELQRMAIRIYNTNKAYHPRGNEQFYESFLLMSGESCFLLITVKSAVAAEQLYNSPFDTAPVSQWELMPLYNVAAKRSVELGESRHPAVYSRGSAYEQKGWHYADPKRNSMLFNYEACKVAGGKRDSYILMGFALPENASALTAPMQQMMAGLKF